MGVHGKNREAKDLAESSAKTRAACQAACKALAGGAGNGAFAQALASWDSSLREAAKITGKKFCEETACLSFLAECMQAASDSESDPKALADRLFGACAAQCARGQMRPGIVRTLRSGQALAAGCAKILEPFAQDPWRQDALRRAASCACAFVQASGCQPPKPRAWPEPKGAGFAAALACCPETSQSHMACLAPFDPRLDSLASFDYVLGQHDENRRLALAGYLDAVLALPPKHAERLALEWIERGQWRRERRPERLACACDLGPLFAPLSDQAARKALLSLAAAGSRSAADSQNFALIAAALASGRQSVAGLPRLACAVPGGSQSWDSLNEKLALRSMLADGAKSQGAKTPRI